jgi:hypothetical protein
MPELMDNPRTSIGLAVAVAVVIAVVIAVGY